MTAFSVSWPEQLLAEVDARVESLGLNRSIYLAALARRDLAAKGAFELFAAESTIAANNHDTRSKSSRPAKTKRRVRDN
jgi:metal-responsive CopG/Arc/MetJ family transcriptional regulator